MFHRRVRRLDIDEHVKLKVLRDGDDVDVPVSLERTRITRSEARRDHNRDFELVVRQTTFFDRDENRWDDSLRGVIVERAERAGWAQLGGLRSRDLIQSIDEFEIRGLKSYRAAMKAVTERESERVVFVVLRGVRTHFQYVEPEWGAGEVAGGSTEAKDKQKDKEK